MVFRLLSDTKQSTYGFNLVSSGPEGRLLCEKARWESVTLELT